MTYKVTVIADTMSLAGIRLTTLEVRFPRFILAEFNTHRVFSRSSASSRAVPVAKNIMSMENGDWFIPERFTKNQKGMQANRYLSELDNVKAASIWARANLAMTEAAQELADLGVHKQHVNRLLEPFLWHTVIVTATDWSNFFNLRTHPDAQPEMQRIAKMMRYAVAESIPDVIDYGNWHLPYITQDDKLEVSDELRLALISAARCARVSYLTHEGKRDLNADLSLATRLLSQGHLSPFEHPATPVANRRGVIPRSGNLRGWTSYRKLIPHEEDILASVPVTTGTP